MVTDVLECLERDGVEAGWVEWPTQSHAFIEGDAHYLPADLQPLVHIIVNLFLDSGVSCSSYGPFYWYTSVQRSTDLMPSESSMSVLNVTTTWKSAIFSVSQPSFHYRRKHSLISRILVWADDRNLLSAMQSRLSASSAGLQSPESTPEHASQARRAQMARSSAEPILQKRPRTLSPPPAPANGAPMTPKHRRIEGSDGTWTRPLTPALTPSQRAARHAEIERGLAEAQKLARLASIQEALSAVQTQRSSKDTVSSDTPSSNSAHYPAQDFPSEYSRLAIIEAALQDSRQQRSDVLPSPSSASRNQALPMALPRPPPPSQSDAGYSISSEIEEADLEDMEDKAIQTDPCDDEESILADFLNPSPTASVLGLPVVYPTSLGCRSASARIGSGPSRASVSRVPDSEHGSESWMPASPGPLLTPERGRSTRARTSGGNVGGGMLLTPPGTSQTDWQPASQVGHGPYSRQYGADAAAPQSPTLRTKGKGRELPRCASASTSLSGGSQWQMVQDDDLVRVQCCGSDAERSDGSLCSCFAAMQFFCAPEHRYGAVGLAGEPIPRSCHCPWWSGVPYVQHLGGRLIWEWAVLEAALRRRNRVSNRNAREHPGIRTKVGEKGASGIE